MKRRDFLKSLLALSIFAPVSRLLAKTVKKTAAPAGKDAKVEKRTINGITVPLLGYGTMRLPRKVKGEPAIDYAKAEKLFARAMAA